MLDAGGDVVGVLVAQADEAVGAGGQPLSYAIPLHNHTEVIALIDASRVAACDPGFEAHALPGRGLMISRVDSDVFDGRADLQDGDVIVAANGESIVDSGDPRAWAWHYAYVRSPATEETTIRIERDSLELTLVGPCAPEEP